MKGREVPKAVLIHWYQCGRKIRYDDLGAATEAAREVTEKGVERPGAKGDLRGYECPFADDGHWHIGRPLRPMPDRTRWRPHDERNKQRLQAAKTWDRIAYRSNEALDDHLAKVGG